MDKRQKLRDLQSRLAEKLQVVRSGDMGATASWLAVVAGEKRYLFPLGQSGEIFPVTTVQSVAYAKNWYLGVANLRGSLFGIVDIASYMDQNVDLNGGQKIGFKEPTRLMSMNRTESRFVTLNPLLEMNCALSVDRVGGLRSSESFRESHEAELSAPAYFGHIYTDMDGLTWQEINLQRLSQQPDFLNIAAS